ncbi:MAG: hypothetical protein CVT47_02820 [Thermoplasmata archaeon HGW-Thermoplasmata-2]|nr:MAG: hypothetical protein CVT47_02820 [Thermoplasmata archaeon HGW-Thermoplasmata-2]
MQIDAIEIIDSKNSTLKMTPDEKIVVPGETATYKFRVTNIGNFADTAYLSTSLSKKAESLGWSATILDTKFKKIDNKVALGEVTGFRNGGTGPGVYAEVILNVTAPLTAQVGEYLPITVTAVSAGDAGKSAMIEFITRIGLTHGVAAQVLPAEQNIHAGESAKYAVVVKNTGSAHDDFTLSPTMESAAVAAGWTYSISDASFSIPPGRFYSAILTVNAPSGAANESKAKVNITATCVQSPDKKSNASSTTTVKAKVDGVKVAADRYSANTPSGTSVAYEITVTNTKIPGTDNRTDNISLTAMPVPEGWNVTLKNMSGAAASNVTLGPGNSTKLTLTITVPLTALAGAELATIVKAISGNNAAAFDSIVVVTRITGIVDVMIECDNVAKNVEPGTSVAYSLRVRNFGTDWDTIRLSTNVLPTGWNATLSSTSATLKPMDYKNVTLTITAPSTAAPRTYILTNVKATSATDPDEYDSIILNTTIATYDLNITSKYGKTEEYVLPGGAASYVLVINNTGTTSDTQRISVSIPQSLKAMGWNATIDKTTVTLDPANTADVLLRVTAPINATASSSASVTVSASSASSASKPSVTRTLSTVTHVFDYVTKDVDGDGAKEFAVDKDRNATNGYEYFMEYPGSSNITHMIKSVDLNSDKKLEFLLGRGLASNVPVKYWDPNRGILTDINHSVGMDNDSKPEYFIDTTGAGKPTILYDMENGTWLPVLVMDVNGDGKPDYLVDENKDGIYDKYHDPAGEEGNYAVVYYDEKTGTYSSAPPAEKTPFGTLMGALGAYWYLLVLMLAVVILGFAVYGARKK